MEAIPSYKNARVAEMRKIAADKNIPNRSRMKKPQLYEAVYGQVAEIPSKIISNTRPAPLGVSRPGRCARRGFGRDDFRSDTFRRSSAQPSR